MADGGKMTGVADAERSRSLAARLSPATGLATDYLNHFNEITMLLGLLPGMPDVLDDIRAWRPLDYEGHFRRSGLGGREAVIEAYRAAQPAVRGAFEAAVAALDESLLDTVAAIEGALPTAVPALVAHGLAVVGRLLARVSGVIHGVETDADLFPPGSLQDTLDVLFAGSPR